MDFFYFMLLFLAAVGVFLIVVPVFAKENDETGGEHDGYESALLNYVNMTEKLRGIDTSIAEADGVISELNNVSENVFKEIDGKYQELLYLYNLIDEKKKLMSEEFARKNKALADDSEKIGETVKKPPSGAIAPVIDTSAMEELLAAPPKKAAKKRIGKNPKTAEILSMRSEGFSVTEIAQILEMGQGEVSLILSLEGGAEDE